MIWQMIEDWFRGILTDGILSNLSGLFDSVNTEVGEIATQVGTTPAGWNAGIFNMIRSLSENVIVPIAGVIITFVMCYELIQLVIEKNNLHDLDTWIFFKWIFKTFVAVLLVTNTWNIVMGVFDITQSVVNDSAGVIISDTSIDIATVITDIEAKLDAMSVGGLLGLWFQSLFVGLTMKALSICIMLVVYGRMIEIYLVTSIAPIPVLPPQRIVSSAALNVCRDLRQLPASMQTQYRRFPARSRKRTQAASRLSFRDLRYSLSQPLRLI